MKKVILSAVIIAAVATSCSNKGDSMLPAKKTDIPVFIKLDAMDIDGVTTTETPTATFQVKQ